MSLTGTVFGMVLPWLLVAAGGWLAYQLVRQNGRLLLRLETLEERLAQLQGTLSEEPDAPAGLPVGSAAPAFELPDLAGGRRTLAEFRGRRLLLVFFNPRCRHCRQLAPRLAALPIDGGDGRPVYVLVSTGDAEDNGRLVKEHGLRCPVLLQGKAEVAQRYAVDGTPTGYLLDEQGNIASDVAAGADAVLELAESRASANGQAPPRVRGKANRGLEASRFNRSGLKAGMPAPPFRLPRLDGGELALEDYRGRLLLLVFSDPQCGPCSQLAPDLERFHRRGTGVDVLMVSRRDAETNRRKAAELDLTFPVVLQRHWEVSLLYAMFATPMAYLIDERGVIAADVAKGSEAIRALMSAAVVSALASRRAKEVVPMRQQDVRPDEKHANLLFTERSKR
jgi:peroxiredoxin